LHVSHVCLQERLRLRHTPPVASRVMSWHGDGAFVLSFYRRKMRRRQAVDTFIVSMCIFDLIVLRHALVGPSVAPWRVLHSPTDEIQSQTIIEFQQLDSAMWKRSQSVPCVCFFSLFIFDKHGRTLALSQCKKLFF